MRQIIQWPLLLLFLFLSEGAFANNIVPYLEDTRATGILKDGGNGPLVLYYGIDSTSDLVSHFSPERLPTKTELEKTGQHLQKEVIYFPWTELMVVNEPGKNIKSMGFQYSRTKFSVLGARLRATTNWSKVNELIAKYDAQRIKQGESPGLSLSSLPVSTGVYYPTVTTRTGQRFTIGAEVKQPNPRIGTNAGVPLRKPVADLVALSLQTGAAVGFHYTYALEMVSLPYDAIVEIDWKMVLSTLRKDPVLVRGYAISVAPLTRLTRQLMENNSIKVQMEGVQDSAQKIELAVWDVTRLIIARVFNPDSFDSITNGPKLGVGIFSKAATQAFRNDGFGIFWPSQLNGTHRLREIDALALEERPIPEKIRLVASPQRRVEFTVGVQLGGLCTTHPEFFEYEGQDGRLVKGCPSEVIPAADQPYNKTISPLTHKPKSQVAEIPEASADPEQEESDDAAEAIQILINS